MKALSAPPEIVYEDDSEDLGFIDLRLWIEQSDNLPDETLRIRATAFHNARRLSLEILVAETVRFRRIDDDSDAFVSALNEIFGTNISVSTMAEETEFNHVVLDGDEERVSFKLFYQPDSDEIDPDDEFWDDVYVEMYLDVDIRDQFVRLGEKDPEFRANIVRALTQVPIAE